MQMGIVSLAHSYRVHGTEKEVDWEKVHLQIVGVEARPKAVKHINIFQSLDLSSISKYIQEGSNQSHQYYLPSSVR